MPAGSQARNSGTVGGFSGGPVTGAFPGAMPIHNSKRSKEKENDWTVFDALQKGLINEHYPESADLSKYDWYDIVWQGDNSSCTAWTATDSLLRWHLIKADRLDKEQFLSARFTWMAAKETDTIVDYPTTFIEHAGTPLKAALDILKKYGCVLEEDFPFNEHRVVRNIHINDFYAKALPYRLKSYYSLVIDEKPNVDHLRMWISQQGPIMVMSDLDNNFLELRHNGKKTLDEYNKESVIPDTGHAFALVGYTPEHFIIRNTWDTTWGDNGHAYATNQYISDAVCEGYGICI